MPTEPPSQGPRRHFQRGRRGHDRRGPERRGSPPQAHLVDPRTRSDRVDVEQLLREIRARIAQERGVELTEQQVQDLAARRLESILDPRSLAPSLLDELRRAAGLRPDATPPGPAAETQAPYTFDETSLYASSNSLLRGIRRLLNPFLKLFFDPKPLVDALQIQSRIDVDARRREAARDQRQTEWNALHYEILRRLVSEVAKVSFELQSLELRIESLSAKVDFNERRVRGIEGAMHQARPGAGRDRERERERDTAPAAPAIATGADAAASAEGSSDAAAEAPRRRRRRRRGRRGGGQGETILAGLPAAPQDAAVDEQDDGPVDEPEVGGDGPPTGPMEASIEQASAPERVSSQLQEPSPDAREAGAPGLEPAPEPPPRRDEG